MNLSLPTKGLILIGLILLFYFSFLPNKPQGFIVTGDYRGEIKPCGCSEKGDQGGIERASSFLKDHKQDKVWLDLGNFAANPTEQGDLKNDLFLAYFQRLGLTAMLPGPREFAKGASFFKDNPLPYLLTNQKQPLPQAKQTIKVGGVIYFGYLSPSLLSLGTHHSPWLSGLGPFLANLPKKAGKQVLLFRGSLNELKTIKAANQFDLIIVGNQGKDELKQTITETVENKIYFKPPVKGQGLLVIKDFDDQTAEITWLGSNIADDPLWEKDFKSYDNKVSDLFFAFLEAEKNEPQKRVYKGKDHCINCHVSQGEAYHTTRHAKAFKSLQAVGKEFDPECITCHVVGFKKGGFLTAKLTPELQGVGCENCHGAFKPHKKGWENRKKVTEVTCKGCHNASHSPEFNFENYFKKIVH